MQNYSIFLLHNSRFIILIKVCFLSSFQLFVPNTKFELMTTSLSKEIQQFSNVMFRHLLRTLCLLSHGRQMKGFQYNVALLTVSTYDHFAYDVLSGMHVIFSLASNHAWISKIPNWRKSRRNSSRTLGLMKQFKSY